MAHLWREPLHPALAPTGGCAQLGTEAEITLCNVLGSPICCPQFLVGKTAEKRPVVPQACSISQSGRRFGSSLGWRRVISTPAMAGPALSPGQVWEQPQGPSCHPTPLQSLCPAAGPAGQRPGPMHTPGKEPPCFQQGVMCGTAACPGSQPPFAQLGNREQGQVCPQCAATCAQGKGTWWCPRW